MFLISNLNFNFIMTRSMFKSRFLNYLFKIVQFSHWECFFHRLAVVVCVLNLVITLSLQPIYFRSFYYCIVHSFLLSIFSFSFGLKVEIVLMVARRPSAVFYQIFAVKKYSWTLPLNLYHQLLMMMRWNYFHHPYNRNGYEPI